MGGDPLEPLVGGPVALPARESSEAKFGRWAREQEQVEHDVSQWEELRGVANRGTGGYRIKLEGQTVGRSAKSQEDLLQAIRRRLRYSHPTLTADETETFV